MNWSRLLRYSGLALLLAVLVTGPFFRGLFFWTELLAAIVAVSVGFVLWLIGRRLGDLPAGIPGGAAGWGLLALLGCYLVQFAWAVYPRGNLDWVLRVAAAWMAYVMVRAESGPALRRWLGWGFVLSAAGVAVMGFLEYSGFFARNAELLEALSMVSPGDRMNTTFQYFNTGAAYLLAAVFAAAGLALEDLRPWKAGLSAGLMTLLSLASFFTLSRGALVVLPFGLLILFAGLERSKRWPAILLFGAAWLPMLGVIRYVGPAAVAHRVSVTFGWVGVALAAGALGGVVLSYYLRLRPRVQLLLGALIIAAAAFGLISFRQVGGLLPQQAARLKDINFQTDNVVLRFIYVEDSLRMVSDRPLGRGGWGWARSYRQYQEFDYTAREAHNHYAQTAVEAGLPGLVILLAALCSALWTTWRSRHHSPLAWAMAAAATLIAGHSVIDFNLSFGLVWFLLWSLLGAAALPAETRRLRMPNRWAGAAAAGVAVTAGLLFVGSRYMEQAQELEGLKMGEEAQVAARHAMRYDRLDSQPSLILGDRESLERAARLDPNNARVHFDLAIAYDLAKDYHGALHEAKVALAKQPMLSVYYAKVSSLTGTLMVDALRAGQLEESRHLAGDLVQLGENFTRRKAQADPLQHLWAAPKLTMNPDFHLRYGQALYLEGRYDKAEQHLQEASKVGLLGSEGHLWLYALYERRGDKTAMASLADKPWVRFREQNPVYKAIRDW